MNCLCILDFSLSKTSSDLPIVYLEEAFPNISFLKIFLNRVRMINGIDHIVALVNPEIKDQLIPIFEDLDYIEFHIIPEGNIALHYMGQNQVINSRKWNYNTFRGGLRETSHLDELLPMELIKDISQQIPTNSILYLSPEQPVFDLDYTHQILEANLKKMENKPPFLYRQTVQGLSPVLITKEGFDKLKELNWSPRLVLTTHPGGDGLFILRQKIENEPYDLARGTFLLRNQCDAEHLKFVLDTLEKDQLKWSAKNMIETSSKYMCTLPREVDLELSGTPYPDRCQLPQDIPSNEMKIELFSKLYDEICSNEIGLVSIGDLSDTLAHSEKEKIFSILNSKKPYGLHLILNTETLLLEENLRVWLTIPCDVITLRLTPLSESLFFGIEQSELLINELIQHYQKHTDQVIPNINLELHKNEDNFEDIHTVVNLARKYNCSYNWIAYNDYCQQLDTSDVIQSTPIERYPCEKLLNQVYILSNGKISSCKQDYSGKVIWGDTNEKSISEIWNSSKWSDARRNQLEGNHTGTTDLCKNCSQWNHP